MDYGVLGLWGTQEGKEVPPAETATNAVKNAFQLRSDKAYSLIALNVEKHIQIHISGTTDPLVAWQNLQKHFVSITQIVRLNHKFYAATMQGGDLMKHLTYMTSLAEQLHEMKEDISARKFATVVLGSFPESYDNFLTSLNACNAEKLDWDNIKGLLIEEYLKRKEKNDGSKSQDSALFAKKKPSFGRGRKNSRGGRVQDHMSPDKFQQTAARRGVQNKDGIVCYKCNQVGHIVRNCPLNRNNSKGEHTNIAEGGDAALISCTESTNEWFIDSAATKHMTHNKSLLMNYTQYKTPTDIYLGDNTAIKALGEGMVKLPMGTDFHLELHKVLYVPKLAKNLLSVPAMVSMGAEVKFNNEECIVSKEGKDDVIGKLVNGTLYAVNTVELAQSATDQTAELWHQRLDHLNNNSVDQLAKKEMATGMNCTTSRHAENKCEGLCFRKIT